MKFLVVFVVASAIGLLGIPNVTGQECDAGTNATLVDYLIGRQPLLQCVFSLAINFTLQNENENAALAALSMYNESAFAAVDQGNCSALNTSVLGIVGSFIYLDYAFNTDSAAIRNGLFDAYLQCAFPNQTCDIDYLSARVDLAQYPIGCYLTLANGSYQLSDELKEILDVLSALNETAVYAAIANQCDTLNATFFQIAYTFNRAAELIYNGSNTNVSDAFTMCLFPEPACSIEDANATLNKYEPVFDSLCELEYLFNLTDPESEKLDDADKAYVNACLAVEVEDNCTVVSADVQSFLDAIQDFIDYATGNNESSAEYVNAVNECANSSSTAE